MKKTIGILIAAALLASFCACGKPGEPSMESSGAPRSGNEAPQESGSAIPVEYTSLARLCGTLIKPGLYWQFELPGMEYSREHIAVTGELQDEIYKILTESEPLLRPDMRDDDSRDRMGGAIILDIWGSDDGLYPNSDQLAFAAVIPLGPNDPAAPNSTFLAIGIGGDCYTCSAEVYDKLLSLLQDNAVETHADLEGGYARMTLSQPEIYPVWGETLECGYILLHSSYAYGADDVPSKTKWQLEALDAVKGISLYRMESSAYSDRGALLRIAKLNDIPDYDYVLFFENGYAYRNSNDSSKEVYFALPQEVKPVPDIFGDTASYDGHGDYIVWADQDGMRLSVEKPEGVTQTLILSNTELLPSMFSRPDYPGDLVCTAPRFLCGGNKAASAVCSESLLEDVGVVVFDIPSGKISSVFPYFQPAAAYYPVTDRYIVSRGMGSDTKMLDAETGEVTEIPSSWIGRSYDYKTCIVQDYSSLDARNAPSYICDISDMRDRSDPLLRSGNPYAAVNLSDVTENYAIFSVSDFDGDWIAVTKYRG